MPKLSATFSYRFLRSWDAFWCSLRSIASPLPLLYPRNEIWSDASSKGYGGHLGPQHQPLDAWKLSHAHVTKGKGCTELAEASAVLFNLQRWGERLRGKKVFIYVDNFMVYRSLLHYYPLSHFQKIGPFRPFSPILLEHLRPQHFTPSSPLQNLVKCPRTQEIFEEIDTLVKINNLRVRARWVWGKDNVLADKLSRLGENQNRAFQLGLTPHVRSLLGIEEKGDAGLEIAFRNGAEYQHNDRRGSS